MNDINDLAKNPCPLSDLTASGALIPVGEGDTPSPQDLLEIGGFFYTKGASDGNKEV